MNPSTRFKDAFKIALAMVIAYAIALSQGWESPFWAGLAVAFCALAGVGESLNKGLLRVLGTLFGAVVALALLAMFPQDRWAFLIAMSLFIASLAFEPGAMGYAVNDRMGILMGSFCSGIFGYLILRYTTRNS